MRTVKISERVHYIGVNDRTTSKFEGLWPLPMGISYNSYIIQGSQKCAIIDGVEASHALTHIEHIRALLGDRHPDYLVINHMEPDHSGGITLLRRAFPDITIVGNAMTLAFNRGFYGDGAPTLQVKEGDTLDLGDITLSFHPIPMVHWPETMVTYLPQERMLFSGDAFGCFGALNGAVVDTEMNTDRYFPEMVRYYADIVGKYGAFVQKAIAKLGALEFDTVCSTHGPVWRSRLSEVMELYDRLSRYEPLDNGVTIVYGSMYGNTELMAETAAQTLAESGVRDIAVYNASYAEPGEILTDVFRHRGLIVAAPTYSDGLFPPIATLLQAIAVRGIRDREVALIGGHTWNQQAIRTMQEILGGCDLHMVADPVNFKHAPGADKLSECASVATEMARKLTSGANRG